MIFWFLFPFLILVVNSQLHLHTEVDIGGCYDTTIEEFVHCAAVEKECEEIGNVRFRSAKQLKFVDIEPCTAERLIVGTCGDTGECALTEDACTDPSTFIAPAREDDGTTSGECTAKGVMIDEVFHPTQYGGCRDGVTGEVSCMLTPEDCSQYEAWIPASVVETIREGGCRCNDVRVGLCEGFNHAGSSESGRCAISPDDCEFSAFVPPTDVLKHPALKDCRLCDNDNILDVTSTSEDSAGSSSADEDNSGSPATDEDDAGSTSTDEVDAGSPSTNENDAGSPSEIESSSKIRSSANESDEEDDNGDSDTIVVIISGSVALCVVLLTVAGFLMRLRKSRMDNAVVPPSFMS